MPCLLKDRVANLRVNEIFDVGLIIWELLLVKLPAVERKHEQLQGTL